LIKNVQVDSVLGYYAAGTTARKATTIIDMAGYEGCMFIYHLGTTLNTGVIICSVTGNSPENGAVTGGTALAATATATITTATASTNSAMVVDVYQPEPSTSRYLEAIITPSVANTVILGITAIRYNGKLKPELTTGLLAATLAVSPEAAA